MTMKGTRIATVLAAIAALALVVPASAAPAVKTKVTITQITATGAKGTVTSRNAKCEKRRKVALHFSGEYTLVRIGTDKTNRKGKWSVNAPVAERGLYIATTKAVKRGDVKCARGRSKAVRFSG